MVVEVALHIGLMSVVIGLVATALDHQRLRWMGRDNPSVPCGARP